MLNTAVRDDTAVPVRVKDPSIPTIPCTVPEASQLRRVLAGLRRWSPVDWDQVYDDLDVVLHGETEVSHHAAGRPGRGPLPEYEDADEMVERFRGALRQLVNRGLREDAQIQHLDIAVLIEQAHTLTAEALPGDSSPARGDLRRLAGIVLRLAERLEETGIVKGLVEC
ncbi:DUF6415 family natural product biosynthesis protein [Streptomyces durbertensis]|nr:DUF6415 family natural product biosynthesis protein [Streptomyces durbertensis]